MIVRGMSVFAGTDLRFRSFVIILQGMIAGLGQILGIKQKKLIVSRQPIFTNLKSNTMKTLQKYDFIFNGQIFIEKNVLSRCFFVNISDFQS